MTMNPDPQQSGLLGFFQRMRKPNEQTGLTPFQQFGAALDPLILPQMRAGQQIREQGAQRVAQGNKNKTIQFLQQKASQGDTVAAQILAGLENNSLSVKDAMALYYNQVFAKPKETFKTMTGAQVNEMTGSSLPEDQLFNVSTTGKISKVGAGDTIIGGSEKAWEKGIGELGVKTLTKIQDDAASAVDMIGQSRVLKALMNDPDFKSGALTEPVIAFKKVIEALGGDPANVGSQEAFQAVTAQLILDKMGGSLGVGFSEGDRKFVEKMAPALSTSELGNQLILKMNTAVAERKIEINNFANQYIEQNGMIDQRFNSALMKWAKANPMFVDINPENYFPEG